ncbi:hypothetical protein GCM10010112_75930 [Actinoplanes lobatus]|uniref:Cyclase n=1 Tax=Actinoplanes lobatus TaxID=113568 RepID=A0A7W7MHP8_9ACTN|nr:hypothetical protein [Actinoplanes lobatus]MBB4750543.1 hypothetical protein [Actinoplanes lobatus]GGN90490.1 hypothetical protein GCM10010112_75930 [Actinoplanes lobatus]GIE43779.1 hypothetical protein Alo02nite_66770 [Actinoplanes lobatus]
MNFLTPGKRREAAALIRRGVSFSLSQSFDANGPQKGWRRRTNPVHTMLDTGTLHHTEIAAIATDTWGFEVRPNEFDDAFQPLHQVSIPHIGLFIAEMWDLDALALDCASDGVYEFWLTAAPLPITGAVGSPVNPIAVK